MVMARWQRMVMSRRKLLTRLLALGVVGVVSLIFYFVFVSMPEARVRAGSELPFAVDGDKERSRSGRPLDVGRVAEYCNIPTQVVEGQEGEAPDDYRLLSVFAFIRHGDRTPMASFFNIPPPSPPHGCTMDTDLLQTMPGLRHFVHDMENQKERQQNAQGDFASWSLYPQHASCGNSQLTGRGAVQHLFNGLSLRRKYATMLPSLSFSPQDHLVVHSTVTSRTYQSALAFLYGLLPLFDLAEVRVQASPNIMFCRGSLVPPVCCASLGKLRQEAELAIRLPRSRDRDWISAIPPLAEVLGVKVAQLPGPTQLMDMLQGHACHDVPLPCVEGAEGRRCVTADMLKKLWVLIDGAGNRSSGDATFDRYCRTVMHSLLLETLKSMQDVARNVSKVRFTLYSGHDLTLTPLLQTLGVYDGKWPSYATRIVWELYRKRSAPDRHYLRILYNGRDVTARVRFCQGRAEQGMCSLEYFEEFVTRDNMDAIKVKDMQELQAFCRSKALF